ncbi:MAG: PAS domain S-box protein [Candidatus Omnitrophica bacterium]|nr:PAS domain S-box protein [Candidatus Omnitrophota bacterium]
MRSKKTSPKNKNAKTLISAEGSYFFKKLAELAGFGICCYSLDDEKILFANQGLVNILGLHYKPKDLIGKYLEDIFVYGQKPENIRKTDLAGGQLRQCEYYFKTLKGEDKWVLYDAFVRAPGAKGKRIVEALVKDITYLKISQKNLETLNRKLQMLTECSHALVHAYDEVELLQNICKIAIDVGQYRFAWAGFAQSDEKKSVRPVAWAGYEDGYLAGLELSWGDNELGQGPTGIAIRTGKPSINRNILIDPQYGIWRSRALERGYASSIALPLVIGDKTIGTLNIYSSIPDAFNADEVSLLVEMTNDISYGTTVLRSRIEQSKTEAALSESEERFRRAFENAGIGMALVDLDGRWLKVNRVLCEIVGYSEEELLTMSFQEITHPDDLGADVSYVQKMLSREILYYHKEKRYIHKSGHILWVLLSAALVSAKSGEPLYFVFQIQNITDRKETEEALREGERFLSSFFASIQDGISILDKEMNIVRVNPVMEQWYAHAMPLVGKKCFQAYHGRKDYCEVCPTKHTLEKGIAAHEEVPKRNAQGEIVGWLDLYSFPLIDKQTGSMKGVIEYVRDISSRKEAEEALRLSDKRFTQIADNACEWIWEVDKDGLYVYSNRAVEKILGYTREEVVGKKYFYDFFACELQGTLKDEVFGIFSKKEPLTNFIAPYLSKTGTPCMLEASGTPIVDARGNFFGYRGIATDITKRQALEDLKDDFINTISHELKTPLAITKEAINLVLGKVIGEINEQQEKTLNIAKNNTDRLAHIINKLLNISKIESGAKEFKRDFVDIVFLIRQVADLLRQRITEKGLGLKLLFAKEKIEVYINEEGIKEVFINLIENASKFTQTGFIEISVKETESMITCSVTDTGCGITGENAKKIFSKFQQFTRSGQEGEKGLGIGLSLVKSIVNMHDGQVWVESKPERGSSFIFTLPRYSAKTLLKKCLACDIEKSIKNNAKVSLVIVSILSFESLQQKLSAQALPALLKTLGEIVKSSLRRGEDVVIEDAGEIIAVLRECDKENSRVFLERLQQSLQNYINGQKLNDIIKLHCGVATYPDDGADEETLIKKAKGMQ